MKGKLCFPTKHNLLLNILVIAIRYDKTYCFLLALYLVWGGGGKSPSGPGTYNLMKASDNIFVYLNHGIFLDLSGGLLTVLYFSGCSLEEEKTLSHAKTIRYISPYAYGSSRL